MRSYKLRHIKLNTLKFVGSVVYRANTYCANPPHLIISSRLTCILSLIYYLFECFLPGKKKKSCRPRMLKDLSLLKAWPLRQAETSIRILEAHITWLVAVINVMLIFCSPLTSCVLVCAAARSFLHPTLSSLFFGRFIVIKPPKWRVWSQKGVLLVSGVCSWWFYHQL